MGVESYGGRCGRALCGRFRAPGCRASSSSARQADRRRRGDRGRGVSVARRGRHTSPDRAWARQARRCRRCVPIRRSQARVLRSRRAWRVWRAVSRSTATMTPPQGGHGGKATRRGRVVDGGRRHRRWIRVERVPAAWQCLGATARRQETVEADPHEAFREHVEAEAAEEFLRAEGHQADLAPVAVVLPPKRHLVVGHGDEPMIGDRDPVGVPGQIVEHVARAAERGLGVDDPVVAKEGAKPGGKGALVGESLEVARQPEGPGAKRVPIRPATTFPRNTRLRTFTGRKNDGRACTHRVPSGERPPAGTTQCTCGWCKSVCPHVWRTLRKPSAAPRCFGVRATSRSVAALAWKSRS